MRKSVTLIPAIFSKAVKESNMNTWCFVWSKVYDRVKKTITLHTLALLAAAGLAPSTGLGAVVCPSCTLSVYGIDVTAFNGTIDWSAIDTSQISFGIVKATEGTTFVDPQFANNWSGLASLELIRGAYARFKPGQDPTAQANKYLQTVGEFGPGVLPPMLYVDTVSGMSAADAMNAIGVWAAAVNAATGLNPIIFTGAAIWNGSFNSTVGADLWVAHFGAACPNLPTAWGD